MTFPYILSIITVYVEILISWLEHGSAKVAKLNPPRKFPFSNPHYSTSPITGDQHVTIHVEASNNAVGSICASMMVGHATAVYYVRTSWVWRFAKLKPSKNVAFMFLEPIREILSS